MKVYKKIFLFIFLFLCILFIENSAFALSFSYDGNEYDIDLPSDFNQAEHPDFIIRKSLTGTATYQLGYPASDYDLPFLYYSSSSPTGIRYYKSGTTSYGQWNYYNYYPDTGWSEIKTTSKNTITYISGGTQEGYLIYSTVDVYDTEGNLFFEKSNEIEYIFPYIADTDLVLSDLDEIEDIVIFPASLSKTCLPLNFSIYKNIDGSTTELIFNLSLDTSSPYYLYIVENPEDYWWEIPTELFKSYLEFEQNYSFVLSGINEYNEFSITRSITYYGTKYVPPTDEQLQTDAIKNQTEKIEEQTDAIIEQTEKIEEQTEVNKGIFARIGEILSYINPLSENFFAYKLVGILVDALKSLFVPEERFSWYIF